MAISKGIIKFTGTIDGISFYKSKHGWIVRKAGGPDPEKMKKGKTFARTRENGKEFGACGKAVGQVRRALLPLLKESGDFRMVSRLTKVFMQIKNLDTISLRGKRNVSAGLELKEGKELLEGFEFNSEANIDNLLKKDYLLKSSSGVIQIKELVAKKDLKSPKGSTHVGFKSIVLRIDFTKEQFEIQTSTMKRLALNSTSTTLVLKPNALILEEGFTLCLLQICFYQELNGQDYRMRNAEFNGMRVVGVF